jgi:hypothetical protein
MKMKLNTSGLQIKSNGYGANTIVIDVELYSIDDMEELQAYIQYAMRFTKAWHARCEKQRKKLNVVARVG